MNESIYIELTREATQYSEMYQQLLYNQQDLNTNQRRLMLTTEAFLIARMENQTEALKIATQNTKEQHDSNTDAASGS